MFRTFQKYKRIIALFIVFIIVTVLLETGVITIDRSDSLTASLFFIVVMSFILGLYIKIDQLEKKYTNELKAYTSKQDKINRNLMFAVEEVIELQRQKHDS